MNPQRALTRETPARIDRRWIYIVVKVPRFAFEVSVRIKRDHDDEERRRAMTIGRNFTEALQRHSRARRKRGAAFSWPMSRDSVDVAETLEQMRVPRDGRLNELQLALWAGQQTPGFA